MYLAKLRVLLPELLFLRVAFGSPFLLNSWGPTNKDRFGASQQCLDLRFKIRLDYAQPSMRHGLLQVILSDTPLEKRMLVMQEIKDLRNVEVTHRVSLRY